MSRYRDKHTAPAPPCVERNADGSRCTNPGSKLFQTTEYGLAWHCDQHFDQRRRTPA